MQPLLTHTLLLQERRAAVAAADAATPEELETMLKDANPVIRQCAVDALGQSDALSTHEDVLVKLLEQILVVLVVLD